MNVTHNSILQQRRAMSGWGSFSNISRLPTDDTFTGARDPERPITRDASVGLHYDFCTVRADSTIQGSAGERQGVHGDGRSCAGQRRMPVRRRALRGEAFVRGAYYCHCTICQKSSGEPFEIGVTIKAGTLRFTKGCADVLPILEFRQTRLLRRMWFAPSVAPNGYQGRMGYQCGGLRARQSRRRTVALPHLHGHEASVAPHP
jgi:hypothetical protein